MTPAPAPPAVLARLLAGFLLLGFGLFATGLPAQTEPAKKVREEEEDPAKTPKNPKVPRVPEEEAPKAAPPKVPVVVGDEPKGGRTPGPKPAAEGPGAFVNIQQEIDQAKLTPVKEFFKILLKPHDLLTTTGGYQYRIGLLPSREPPTDDLEYLELNASQTAGTTKTIPTKQIGKLQFHEDLALAHIDTFLKREISGLTRGEQLEIAAKGLLATIRFHEAAREQNKRVGKAWDAVLARLRTRLIEVQREQLQALEEAKQWRQAEALAQYLFTAYPDDARMVKAYYRLRLLRAEQILGEATDDDLLHLRQTMLEFEDKGGQDDPAAVAVRLRLRTRAEEHVRAARKLKDQNQNAAALGRLRTAESIDPDVPGVRELRGQLKGSVLYVGVPRLPDRLSPLTARTDAERWAVELIFEGLLKAQPDPDLGRTYHPVLAESLPGMARLGREFTLRRGVRWCEIKDGKPVAGDPMDARDVRSTLALLRGPKLAPTWAADGLDVLAVDQLGVENPFRLRLPFTQGLLEPLGRTTFKVLPVEYLGRSRRSVEDEAFARSPFGTGPYYYAGKETEAAGREVAVFRVNPYFAQASRWAGPPQIPEVRFCVPKSAVADFESGQLHLLPDVPTAEFVHFRDTPGISAKVRAFTSTTNRRIHMLAVNHRKPALRTAEVRRGLALAIDREAILKDVFRGGEPFHRALTGPFPPESWATPPKSAELLKPDMARTLLAEAAGRTGLKLSLKLPAGDAAAQQACQRIKEQVEKTGGAGVTIDLQPLAPEVLQRKVEQEHDYDLAYWSFDYSDDLFRLDGLLDASAAGGRDARNFLGYLAEDTGVTERDRRLRQALQEARSHCDFTRQVKEKMWELHGLFNQQVPFVPLWQLDRHFVVASNVEINVVGAHPGTSSAPLIDPAVLFTDIERWKLNTGP